MTRQLVAAMAVLSLCACGDSGGGGQRNVARVEMANPVSEQLKAGNDLFRSIGLRRPIVDSGHRCKRVDAGGYQQQYKNFAMWTVHCTDTGDWAVFIGPGGEAQARACKEAAQLGLPACKAPPPLASQPPSAEAKAQEKSAR